MVIASSVVDRGYDRRSCQTKDNKNWPLLLFSYGDNITVWGHRLVGSESGCFWVKHLRHGSPNILQFPTQYVDLVQIVSSSHHGLFSSWYNFRQIILAINKTTLSFFLLTKWRNYSSYLRCKDMSVSTVSYYKRYTYLSTYHALLKVIFIFHAQSQKFGKSLCA
jgi:hypothetical protein